MICISATSKFLAKRNICEDVIDVNRINSKEIWYLNEIIIDRRKTWVFMNDWSHFSFIKIGMLANDEERLYDHFMNGMIMSMKEVGLTKRQISEFVSEGESVKIIKCSNLSKIASLSDLCKRYKEQILYSEKDISSILNDINQMPQGGIGMDTPLRMIQKETNA
ncbi:MAG: hypothetical protein WCX75_09240 [Fibrobacteraceae bacterium]